MRLRTTILSILLCLLDGQISLAQNVWCISTTNLDAENYYGATVANGMIGIKSSLQPLQTEHMIMAGAYDKYGRGNVDNILMAINFMNVVLVVDKDTISLSNISHYQQSVHFKEGYFSGSFDVSDKLHLEYQIYALRHLPYCALMNITISPLKDIPIHFIHEHNSSEALKELKIRHSELIEGNTHLKLLSSDTESKTGKIKVCATSIILAGDDKVYQKGKDYHVSIVGACVTSAHHSDPANEAERLAIFTALEGCKRLKDTHTNAWSKLWMSDICVEGDSQIQQDVHNMLFQLYGSVREDSHLSIPPMGLTSNGYNGHIFWDADLWMMPPLLVLHPDLARQLIEYRIDRLTAARQNAYAHGFKGAMFPWESSDTGEEVTPTFALTGPFEHHITGCVALAAWQYFCVSRDTTWLRNRAWPLLKETAAFWESRIEKEQDGWHIRNVVCPDEWAMNVDDNAFTNAIAAKNIEIAIKAAQLLGVKGPVGDYTINNAASVPDIEGATREHASYKGEAIKQADVSLLAYPLGIIKEKSQILRDMEFYIPRIPHDNTPAMSDALFSLLYARLGDTKKALYHFHAGYDEYLCPPFRQMAEEKGGKNPYFITGAGGLLQALIMGFAGYGINDDGLFLGQQHIPQGWRSIIINR